MIVFLNVFRSTPRLAPLRALIAGAALLLCVSSLVFAQDDAFGDGAADPVKLFERGQNAQARGELEKALEFYDEAIKVRPEFAEAEFQRASALFGLGRLPEAETGFKRSIELRKNWSLPYSGLGTLLVRVNRDPEAEIYLRQAIKLDPQNYLASRMLADIRYRANDYKEALELIRTATKDPEAPASIWLLRAIVERAAKDNAAALTSLNQVLDLDPTNLRALLERAEVQLALAKNELAIKDLKAAESLIKDDKANASRLVAAYEQAGKSDDAQRVAESAGLKRMPQESSSGALKVIGTPEEIETANSADPAVARKALELLLTKNPKNAMLLARLGAAYRTVDSSRSLDYYKQAIAFEPTSTEYATGYGSALIQAKRFGEAATLLQRVTRVAPDNYTAHANLATALYELKQFRLALDEYEWLQRAKPDLSVLDYFIATAHDSLGEYPEALTAYESFLARADVKTTQLEIEKVKLRLPSLRRQIQLGQGAKRTDHAKKN